MENKNFQKPLLQGNVEFHMKIVFRLWKLLLLCDMIPVFLCKQ